MYFLKCTRLGDLLSYGSLLHTVCVVEMYVWWCVVQSTKMRYDIASMGIFRFGQDETKSLESGKSVSDSPSLSLTRAFIQSQICGGPIEWQRWNCHDWNFWHRCNVQLWKPNDIDIDTVDIGTDLQKRNYMLNIFVQYKHLKGRLHVLATICWI